MKYLLVVLALCLSACVHQVPDQPRHIARSHAPISQWMVARNSAAGVTDNSPALIRIFKREAVLELWRQRGDKYVLVAVFDICKYSGHAGPKKRTGDRQAPEGFYQITPAHLNPFSQEWLSINTGFPNQYDRSQGYTGHALMIHGGCSSAGCYALRDGPMQDLYASVRDAFAAGQKQIQIQIYPERWGWSADLSGPDQQFWQQLKTGYDLFEKTRQPVQFRVEKNQYVFDQHN
jgi:murein L,D-transpeptidase YafK